MSSARLTFVERPAQGTPRGLLLLLHGVGADERSLGELALEQAPDQHVILPRGPLTFAPGAYGFFQVRFGPDGPVIDPAQAEASRRLLIDFVAAQQARLGIAPARTVIAGFSQGGIMSASVGLTAPASVAGFAILSGRILPEIEPQVPADVGSHTTVALVMHGRRDDKLPFALAERSAARLAHFGIAHELRAYDAGHALTPAMRSDFRAWLQRMRRD
ncbi:alpha/beta hydrolase [Xanthomonas massiliensis]|uniref:alpha/beta hydrolase n=1 Tax=Xanthomonas massiliensis TaxID=1720302 RepID=UPI0008242833|nr:hypothetical protein [Xanthomonas massiliensis]